MVNPISPTHFITSIGTDIGKSYVMEQLIRAYRTQRGEAVMGLKPILSGYDGIETAVDSDTGRIISALGLPLNQEMVDRVTPWRFKEPLSPDMAARRANTPLKFEPVIDYCRKIQCEGYDRVLIEGVGGVMVPLNDHCRVIDWIEALNCDIVLVASNYLGAMSHTFTAYEALKSRGLEVSSVIVSEYAGEAIDMEETCQSLSHYIPADIIQPLYRNGSLVV